ncbi:unnamed protein product [Trichogramma brassicae]|uniref:Uncharacterized protein n=1 Tax=Trichogramma brassicae TaxID=86971 RepID=A0A6H5I1R8_9HYME|nr:unnamed protein product [Trichogramma brassicae]
MPLCTFICSVRSNFDLKRFGHFEHKIGRGLVRVNTRKRDNPFINREGRSLLHLYPCLRSWRHTAVCTTSQATNVHASALLLEQWKRAGSITCWSSTRRLRHYRSGLRALRRGRRPRQRGSVAQPEQHDLSASRAASRRGAGEIHSRAAEQGRGGARRQALLPNHMSGEEVPSARQQFEGGDRADARFRARANTRRPCATCSARSAI